MLCAGWLIGIRVMRWSMLCAGFRVGREGDVI